MFIAETVRQLTQSREPLAVLDACAAPGGKTTAIIDSIPDGSLVVANEYDYRRASVLTENIIKWGSPDCVISRGDTAKFAKSGIMFDIAVVDAPCSGEGMMRKEPDAVSQWTPGLVEQCAQLQRTILTNIWTALKPGGCLIYSTCTFNRRENEDNIHWLIDTFDAEPVEIETKPEWNIIRSPLTREGVCALRFFPGVIEGEGLFIAAVRKPGTPQNHHPRKEKNTTNTGKAQIPKIATSMILNPEDYDIIMEGDTVSALPRSYARLIEQLKRKLDVVHAGVTIGTIKGKDLIPSQSLAMSKILNRGMFPAVELSLTDAINYLRRETITLPSSTPRGYVVATYGDVPLGFVKNIGNRSNNLYPPSWRILKK